MAQFSNRLDIEAEGFVSIRIVSAFSKLQSVENNKKLTYKEMLFFPKRFFLLQLGVT